jgi:serine-type D-Ala-D-Ala carboxypeptidase/endopeptidase (penicillin-binding protein 4)
VTTMSAVLDLLSRLSVPIVLLLAVISISIAIGEVGNDELPVVTDGGGPTYDSPETPVFSIRRAPTLLTSPQANEDLRAELAAWVATLPASSCFVISAGGDVIYDHQGLFPVIPASNMKILTAYAALEMLGPDYRFVTSIQARSEPDDNGKISGDLYVIGGGDPVLMTDAYAAVQPPKDSLIRTRAEDLADLTHAANVVDITGGIQVVETRYDEERAVSTWSDRFIEQSQAGPLSAALLDDGFEGFKTAYAGQEVPDPPPLPRADEPAELFAKNFDDLLEALGVRIFGSPGESDEPPADLIELTSISSPPIVDIVEQMLVNSDNTTAELLLKEIAVVGGSVGSTTAGAIAVRELISASGLPNGGVFNEDGSGLSESNTLTCALVHATLDDPAHKSELRDAMAVAGESGTLADSFIGSAFEGALRAKTGFLATVSALSGYYVTDRGVEVTFSLIVNTADENPISEAMIAGWQAPLPDILSSYPSGPPISDLQPKGIGEE